MDQNRQIRFLIPPFFLWGALFLANYLYGFNIFRGLSSSQNDRILEIAAGLAALTIPMGFFIGAISLLLLYSFSILVSIIKRKRWNYEAAISDEACKRIWQELEVEVGQKFDLGKRFYISATFDHSILDKGINEWIMRRWNAFNLHIHCATALLLAIGFCWWFPSSKTAERWHYIILIGAVIIILTVNAVIAWLQTMKMIEFQSIRKQGRE
jgi:hypothetical protein